MDETLDEMVVGIALNLPEIYQRCMYGTCKKIRSAMRIYKLIPSNLLIGVQLDTLIKNNDWNVLQWFLLRSKSIFRHNVWKSYFNDNHQKTSEVPQVPDVIICIKLLTIIPTLCLNKLCLYMTTHGKDISKKFILFVKEALGMYGRLNEVGSLSTFDAGENIATNFISKCLWGKYVEYTRCDEHHMHPIMWCLNLSKVGLSYCTVTEQILKFIIYRVNNIGLFHKYISEGEGQKTTAAFMKYSIMSLRYRCLPILDHCIRAIHTNLIGLNPDITIGSVMVDIFTRPCDVGDKNILEMAMELWTSTHSTDFYDDLSESVGDYKLHFNRTILTEIFPNNRTPENQMKAYLSFYGLKTDAL